MIARKPIIFAMVTSDMRSTALYHEILKYKDICMADVNEIIRIGTHGYLERYERIIAYILDLKRFIPEGWKPTLRVIRMRETNDLPVQLNLDITRPVTKRGKDHHNYKNGNGVRAQDTLRNKIKRGKDHHGHGKHDKIAAYNEANKSAKQLITNHNSSRVKEIIHMLGGTKSLSIITGTGERTVRDWPKLMKNNTLGYIPQKYIYKISKFARDYGINVTRDELERLLP